MEEAGANRRKQGQDCRLAKKPDITLPDFRQTGRILQNMDIGALIRLTPGNSKTKACRRAAGRGKSRQ